MLGVILLYVGMVLMSNGLHRLEGIPDKSNVVMNIFTGGLGLILNIIVIAYGACTGQGAEWLYGRATGLLFAFTYLYSAINTIFDFDQRLYGWFSLFVAINTLPAGILCLTSGYGGNAWYGMILFLWGILGLNAFIEINLQKHLGKIFPYLSIFEGIGTAGGQRREDDLHQQSQQSHRGADAAGDAAGHCRHRSRGGGLSAVRRGVPPSYAGGCRQPVGGGLV